MTWLSLDYGCYLPKIQECSTYFCLKKHYTHLSSVSGRRMGQWLVMGDSDILAPQIFELLGVEWPRKEYEPVYSCTQRVI